MASSTVSIDSAIDSAVMPVCGPAAKQGLSAFEAMRRHKLMFVLFVVLDGRVAGQLVCLWLIVEGASLGLGDPSALKDFQLNTAAFLQPW